MINNNNSWREFDNAISQQTRYVASMLDQCWPNLSNAWYLGCFNPLSAKLFNLNFHPLDVVSRRRDPQLQVSENYSDLTKWRSTIFKYCWLMLHFILNMFKRWYLMCKKKTKSRIYAAPAVKGFKRHGATLLYKAKWQHLPTGKVSRYCLFALHG